MCHEAAHGCSPQEKPRMTLMGKLWLWIMSPLVHPWCLKLLCQCPSLFCLSMPLAFKGRVFLWLLGPCLSVSFSIETETWPWSLMGNYEKLNPNILNSLVDWEWTFQFPVENSCLLICSSKGFGCQQITVRIKQLLLFWRLLRRSNPLSTLSSSLTPCLG